VANAPTTIGYSDALVAFLSMAPVDLTSNSHRSRSILLRWLHRRSILCTIGSSDALGFAGPHTPFHLTCPWAPRVSLTVSFSFPNQNRPLAPVPGSQRRRPYAAAPSPRPRSAPCAAVPRRRRRRSSALPRPRRARAPRSSLLTRAPPPTPYAMHCTAARRRQRPPPHAP